MASPLQRSLTQVGHARPIVLGLAAFVGSLGVLVACANGSSSDVATDSPEQSSAPTEPEESSTTLPADADSGTSKGKTKSDAGTSSSSSSSSSGGSTSSSSSSGGTSSSSSSSSSSGGTSSSSSSSSSSGGTCVTTAPSNVCGLAPQCGCTATQTCDVTNYTTGASDCVTAGSGALAASCTSTSNCAPGLTCMFGTCRPYCDTVGSACSGSGLGECQQVYDTNDAPVKNTKVCAIACDILNPSAACGANNCVWDATIDEPDCVPRGTGSLYAQCDYLSDCKQGLGCAYNPDWGYECEEWCRIGKSGDCSYPETCVDVYGADAPVVGGSKLGHCQ